MRSNSKQLAIMKFCVPLAFILGLAFCIDLSTSEESILGVARDRLTQFRAQIAAKLKSALGNQHETLSDFVTDFKGNFNRKLSDVRHCYEARFANQELNIFNNSMSFKSIAQNFYEKFSNKTITRKSLRQLRSSIREIIRHCLKNRRTTVRFGFTEFSDWSDKEMKRMMGFVPSNFTETQNNSQLNRRKRSNSQCVIDERAPLPARFDWREADKVTPVKFQRRCGSCWAFAANAAIESAWLIKRGYKASKTNPDLSEQHLVNCAYVEFGDPQNKGCSGANADIAFNYHLKRGYA